MNHKSYLNRDILYYPNIEFQDVGFIKSALCIWDTVYRIVPESYIPCDTDEIKVAVEEGVIKNIRLSKEDIQDASNKYFEIITHPKFKANAFNHSKSSNLNINKVDQTLLPLLESLTLETVGDWIRLPEIYAHGYMLFLANSISEKRNISKITDNARIFSIMPYYETDTNIIKPIQVNKESMSYYSSIIIPALIPNGIKRTSIDTVLRFREKTQQGRDEFRDAVTNFIEEIKVIEDKDYANEIIHSFKDGLDHSKKSIKETGMDFFKNFILSTLTIGVPVTLTSLPLLGCNKAIIIGILATLADQSKNKNLLNKKSDSYYLQVQQKFNDNYNNIDNYSNTLNEYLYD